MADYDSDPEEYREEDDLDVSDEENDSAPCVQLGFLSEHVHAAGVCAPQLARRYFPSKLGGRPAWLNPRDLPPTEHLTCDTCQTPLRFLLQVYAPLDDQSQAFHRILYVFCCQNSSCLATPSGLKVLRSQLRRNNEFYPSEPVTPPDETSPAPLDDSFPGVTLCRVCGLHGTKKCGKCARAVYCSRACQKADWTLFAHNTQCPGTSGTAPLPALAIGVVADKFAMWPEQEIEIDEEILNDETSDHQKYSDPVMKKAEAMYEQYKKDMAEESQTQSSAVAPVESPTTETATAESADEPAVAVEAKDDSGPSIFQTVDSTFINFQLRVAQNHGQVLRYCREPGAKPLWVHDKQLLSNEVPACTHCGAERIFEMQILPQLLYFLQVEQRAEASGRDPKSAIDWATLVIYTCARSCEQSKAYVEEFVYRQPPAEM